MAKCVGSFAAPRPSSGFNGHAKVRQLHVPRQTQFVFAQLLHDAQPVAGIAMALVHFVV